MSAEITATFTIPSNNILAALPFLLAMADMDQTQISELQEHVAELQERVAELERRESVQIDHIQRLGQEASRMKEQIRVSDHERRMAMQQLQELCRTRSDVMRGHASEKPDMGSRSVRGIIPVKLAKPLPPSIIPERMYFHDMKIKKPDPNNASSSPGSETDTPDSDGTSSEEDGSEDAQVN